MKIANLLLLTIISALSCCGQQPYNFSYKPYDIKGIEKNLSFEVERINIERKAFNLINLLPKGYVTDGSVDYTSFIQSGLNKYNSVIFPNFPILINEKGLTFNSGQNAIFKPNSILVLKPNSLKSYKVLLLHNVENVKIFNLNIKGDRRQHFGNEGEWGIGVSIRSSKNVYLINPTISDCWGDGIYVGKIIKPSEKIFIYNPYLDYNRRNGISIISVIGLTISKPVITNIDGTNPMAAIDIEPNNNKDFINDVRIDNPITFNSKNGILIVLGKLSGPIIKSVDIQINNHLDMFSYTAFYISGFNKPGNGLPLKGKIIVSNPTWKYNSETFRKKKQYDYAPIILFQNIKIIKSQNGVDRMQVDSVNKIKSLFSNHKRISFN